MRNSAASIPSSDVPDISPATYREGDMWYLRGDAGGAVVSEGRCPYLIWMNTELLLGAHVSVARGAQIGCTAIQLFTKNNNRWEGKPLTAEDIESYKTALAESRIGPVVSH